MPIPSPSQYSVEITRLGANNDGDQWFSVRVSPMVLLGRLAHQSAWTVYVDGQELPLVTVYPYNADGRAMFGEESLKVNGQQWGIEINRVVHTVDTQVLGQTLQLLNHAMRTAANYNPFVYPVQPGFTGYAPLPKYSASNR